MFFPLRSAPLDLSEDGLTGLRFSLNAPVIDLADLPVGPARAAILLHLEEDGRPNVTIGVRSLKSGEVALYSYDGSIRGEDSLALGADAALSFGESMGFLFDDDELEGDRAGDRARALGLWRDLLGGDPLELAGGDALGVGGAGSAEAGPAAPTLDRSPLPSGPEELLLEDIAEPPLPSAEPIEVDGSWSAPGGARKRDDAPATAGPPTGPVAEPVPAPLMLSKFRQAEDSDPARIGSSARAKAAAEARPRRRTALGRLKLVRRRLGSRQADGRNWVTRLLTSF